MNLKDLLGDAYKEEMTAEEIAEALKSVEMPKDNSAEIAKLKESISNANSEAKKYKDELRAKLSEEERKAKEDAEKWEKVLKERDELLKEKNISTHKAKFLENGYTPELAEKSAEALVNGDFEAVFKYLGEYRASIEKQFKAENVDNMPKPSGGGQKGTTVTKEQFAKMSYAEMTELYQTNPELYAQLTQ